MRHPVNSSLWFVGWLSVISFFKENSFLQDLCIRISNIKKIFSKARNFRFFNIIKIFFFLNYFLDATPAAFSEDSQEAMNNSHSKEQPSKNITNAEAAEKNLPDLTGENQIHCK